MSDLMKSLLANAGLNTASFSQEEFETPVDEVIAAATGEEDVLAEDVATIEEDSEELEAQVSDLDTAGEAAEELEDVAVSLESMIADGGLDQRTHGYVMTTAAAILKQVGVSVPNIGLSQESFDTTEGRVRAATMTMEFQRNRRQDVGGYQKRYRQSPYLPEEPVGQADLRSYSSA